MTTHDPAMVKRIALMFDRTWDVIYGDIADSFKQDGSRESKAVLRKGEISVQDGFDVIYDYLTAYGDDPEAFKYLSERDRKNDTLKAEVCKLLQPFPLS